ncbi:MAG TPA: hypothetical protein VFJ16_02925 [Longimicrobium sp.]|nr:hypothetical protein [Longimicrobium sp.]
MSTHHFRGTLAAAVLAAAAALPAAAQTALAVPFTISVREITAPGGTPQLQSFAMGRLGGDWVLIGGRRNGFHRTSTRESTFPTTTANDSIYVVDMTARRTYSAPLPDHFRSILRVSNTNFVQDGNFLYIVGGYGSTCDSDEPSCYQTYPNLSIITLPTLIEGVKSGRADFVNSAMSTVADERMRVTGGALEKIGDRFYLVMGHDYNSIYKGAVTGIYTEQVRTFRLPAPYTPAIQDYQAYGDPSGRGPTSQWHRRDLNVVPTVQPGGVQGLAVYGGVFTPTSGAWVNPMYMTLPAGGGTPVFTVDSAFSMKTSQYECAHVTMYDPGTGTMYTTLLGGISGWYYDANGTLVPGGLNNSLPWTGTITTLARSANGTTQEVVQPASQGLPGRRGANAVFVPDEARTMVAGTHEVIDYSQLPAGDSVRVGWMYGGIFATADQSSEFDPTFASDKIYEVWLRRPPAVALRE